MSSGLATNLSLPERLKRIRGDRDVSQAVIADILDLTQSRYGHYESGRSEPPVEVLARIVERLDVSPEWLLTGSGEMKRSVPALGQAAGGAGHDLPVAPSGKIVGYEGGPTVRIPIYEAPLGASEEWTAPDARSELAGYGEFFVEWIQRECRIDPLRAFVAPVFGDSMEDLLYDGDLIVGERQDYIDRDGIFALVLNSKLLIKHVIPGRRKGDLALVSRNSTYPPREVSERNGDVFNVIGRYVRRITR